MLPAAPAGQGRHGPVSDRCAPTPCARIECRPHRMVRARASIPRNFGALLATGAAAGGPDRLRGETSDRQPGQRQAAASWPSAVRATRWPTPAPTAVVGPNLDDAFRQDRADGLRDSDIRGLVDYWIQYPNVQGAMPAGCSRAAGRRCRRLRGPGGGQARPGHRRARHRGSDRQPEARGEQERRGSRSTPTPPASSSSSPRAPPGRRARDAEDEECLLGPARHRHQGRRSQSRWARSSPMAEPPPSPPR